MKNPKLPVDPTDARETLVVEASLKPFISLVWAGIIIMVLGFGVARSRRASDARKLESYEIAPEVKRAALAGDPVEEPVEVAESSDEIESVEDR